MPPKPKFTKAEIIEAAYTQMQLYGIDAVVAREVGKQLGSTTAPIFTYFPTMDALKTEVFLLAQKRHAEYLRESLQYFPSFKEFGLRWIRFAHENPNIYAMLFLNQYHPLALPQTSELDAVISSIEQELTHLFGLSSADAGELVQEMCIFAQGITTMLSNGLWQYDEASLRRRLSQVCISCVAGFQILNDTISLEEVRNQLQNTDIIPVKKSSLPHM